MQNIGSNITKIQLFNFFISMHFIAGILVPFFLEWGNITFTQVMIIQAWFMLWVFILEIPTGTVADYLGRKHSISLAVVINVIAALVYASNPSFYIFLLGEFLWAVSTTLISGASEAFVYDTLKKTGKTKDSKQVFGRIESYRLAGLMLGAPLGSIIAAKLGLRAPMLLLSVPFSIAFLISLTLKEPNTHQKTQKSYIDLLKGGIRFFYQNRILKILALDWIVIDALAFLMIWLYQLMLKEAGISIAYFGIVSAAIILVEITIMNNYNTLEKILGSKNRLIFSTALITGIMFILGGITTFIPLILLSILGAAGIGLSRRPLFISYMNKYIPSEERATVLSTITMLRSFLMIVLYPLIGLLTEWSLSYTLIILGIAVIIFTFISKIEENHLID